MNREIINLNETKSRTKKQPFFYTCRFLKDFKEGFSSVDLVILLILTLVILISALKIVKFNLDPELNILKKFIPLLLTYYSITIGFTLSSMTFMIGNVNKYKGRTKKLFKNIITFCISYIIISLVTIITFLSMFLVMQYFNFQEVNFWSNVIIYFFPLILPMFSFYIFTKITLIIYLFTLNLFVNSRR